MGPCKSRRAGPASTRGCLMMRPPLRYAHAADACCVRPAALHSFATEWPEPFAAKRIEDDTLRIASTGVIGWAVITNGWPAAPMVVGRVALRGDEPNLPPTAAPAARGAAATTGNG